jgi:hypothetical protein
MHAEPMATPIMRIGLALTAAAALIVSAIAATQPAQATDHGDVASLNIRKVNEAGDRLAGAVFSVEGMDETFTTGADGQVCLTGLPADAQYTVTEIEAPDGYEIADPASQLVEVDNDGDCDSPDATFVNTLAAEQPGEGEQGAVMIMKHVCPDEIQTAEQFDALGGFLDKVLACPVITLPGDVGPDGALDADDDFFDQFVEGGSTDFNFTAAASNGTWDLTGADFMPAQVCEADVNADADGDGEISADVCIEVSHYAVDGVAEGNVTVTEAMPPSGFRFGDIEFTPNSGDDATLVSIDPGAGVVALDTTLDDATTGVGEAGPRSVMIHVYNFANLEGTQGGQPTPTPGEGVAGEGTLGGTLPDTRTAGEPAFPAAPLLALISLTAVGWSGLRLARQRRRIR